jgi:hypothetical protein
MWSRPVLYAAIWNADAHWKSRRSVTTPASTNGCSTAVDAASAVASQSLVNIQKCCTPTSTWYASHSARY